MISTLFSSLSHSPIVRIVLGLLFTALVYSKITLYLRRRRYKLANGCKPLQPAAFKRSFLGIDAANERFKAVKEKRLLDLILQLTRDKGLYTIGTDLIVIPGIFGKNIIVTIEPENVKTVLSIKFKDFGLGNRIDTLGMLLGRGIFTTDGEEWAHSRAMIRPNFVRDQVADLAAFEQHMQSMIGIIPTDGTTVDLQELFFKMTIDSATEFLFGESTHTLRSTLRGNDSGSGTDFASAFTTAQEYCAAKGRVGFQILSKLYQDPAGPDAIKICQEFVDQFVDRAVQYREKLDAGGEKAVAGEKYVFLHELAKATTDKRKLRDELLNVLLAGRDTTASLLANMWFMITQRPEVMAKLRNEVDTLGGQPPTYEQVRNMKYLKYCMNESLRVHPVVPANARFALNDTFLPVGGGPNGKDPLFVPKDSVVAYNVYGMHHRTDLYGPDADEFRPERWESLRPGWEYLPFNGGPRICLGQQYALTEAGYISIRLLQEFNIESRDMGPWVESLTLTCCSGKGTPVAITKRTD